MLVIFACIQSLRTEMLVARAWGWFEPVSEKAVLSTTSAGQEHRATPWCLSISWSVSQWQCCLSIRKQTIHCCAIKRWAHWHTYLWVWTFICHLSLLVGVLCACMNQTAGVTLVTTRLTPHPKHTDTHTLAYVNTHTLNLNQTTRPFHLILSHIRWDLSLSLFLQTGALLHPWWGVCAQSESFLLCLCVCIRVNTRTQHCTALSSISLVPKKVCMHMQALVLYLSEGKRERESKWTGARSVRACFDARVWKGGWVRHGRGQSKDTLLWQPGSASTHSLSVCFFSFLCMHTHKHTAVCLLSDYAWHSEIERLKLHARWDFTTVLYTVHLASPALHAGGTNAGEAIRTACPHFYLDVT